MYTRFVSSFFFWQYAIRTWCTGIMSTSGKEQGAVGFFGRLFARKKTRVLYE